MEFPNNVHQICTTVIVKYESYFQCNRFLASESKLSKKILQAI